MSAGDIVREYKKNDIFKISGIDYARVIATRGYDTSIKNKVKELARLVAFDYVMEIKESKNNEIIAVYSYRGKKRPDFDSIFDTFCSYIDDECDKAEFIYKLTFKHTFIKTIRLIKYTIRFMHSGVKHPIYAACLTAQFIHWDKIITKTSNLEKYRLLVTFCDAHGIENMITQMAHEKGCVTATLQHGQYRRLKKETENADVESYENFISDYLFAWGKVTQSEFEKAGINKERVLPVGAIKPFSSNLKMIPHEVRGVFGVVLDGNIYHDSNVEMIKCANALASSNNLKYILRMHPKNDENVYLPICDKAFMVEEIKNIENEKYVEKIDFSLVHMTGVFVELLSINSPMFLFEDKYLEDIFKVKGALFSGKDDLIRVYKKFAENPSKFTANQYFLYSNFNQDGELRKNYRYAVDEIMKERRKE